MAEPHASPPVLWHLKVSHYNEKVRWALDYKGIGHIRKAVTAGGQARVAQRLGGGTTLPVLKLNGQVLGDSTEIIAALEREHPEPPLYPGEAAARRRALELEEFFDEELGPYTRRLAMHYMLLDSGVFLGAFTPDLSGPRLALARALFPLIRRRIRADFELTDQGIAESYERIEAAGERFRAELGPEGYLVGGSFTVADLTLAALLAPVVAPKQFPYPQPQRDHELLAPAREALDRAGLLEWGYEMYARNRGSSAEIIGAASPPGDRAGV